jgi:YegS/Rv2252/BmrU family lipid kinase
MNMAAKVILNPYAGRWLAQQRRSEVEGALQAAGVEYDLVTTDGPGHGISLAEQAVREGFSPVISAGGDGSISEVVNGIARVAESAGSGSLVPFGVIPLGSANDFVDNFGLPRDLISAVQVIAAGQTRLIDLGLVNGRYFDNNAAIGLEPYITLIQQRITRLRGVLRYLVATLMGIWQNPQWTMHLEWDGGEYSGPVTLVTVGNSPRTGGIFYTTPHADPYDARLTFVYGFMPTRLQILRLLPRTMKPAEGNYVEHPSIHEVHTTWLKVRSETPTPAHADGEIISPAIHELEYRICPARLPVLLP